MKGGFRAEFNIDSDVMPRFSDARQHGKIAIPSQKRGICLTDAFQSCFWYGDEIRDVFWDCIRRTYAKGKPGDVSIDTKRIDNKIDDYMLYPESDDVKHLLVNNWLVSTAARIGVILKNNPIEPSESGTTFQITRTPSSIEGHEDMPHAVGETCALWYYRFNDKFINKTEEELAYTSKFGRSIEAIEPISTIAFELLGVESQLGCSKELPEDAVPLCMLVTLTSLHRKDNVHLIAIIRINRRWFFFDNNVGVGIELNIDADRIEGFERDSGIETEIALEYTEQFELTYNGDSSVAFSRRYDRTDNKGTRRLNTFNLHWPPVPMLGAAGEERPREVFVEEPEWRTYIYKTKPGALRSTKCPENVFGETPPPSEEKVAELRRENTARNVKMARERLKELDAQETGSSWRRFLPFGGKRKTQKWTRKQRRTRRNRKTKESNILYS